MTDEMIIDLYFARSEQAVAETDRSYGAFCRRIAINILELCEDAEECVNDTYLHTWNSIPPERPLSLKAFLGRIVRNIAISRYRKNHAKKRGASSLTDELDECVPENESLWQTVEGRRLSESISRWLRGIDNEDCAIFVRRYYHGESVNALAKLVGTSPEKLASRLFRLRQRLKKHLEKESFDL